MESGPEDRFGGKGGGVLRVITRLSLQEKTHSKAPKKYVVYIYGAWKRINDWRHFALSFLGKKRHAPNRMWRQEDAPIRTGLDSFQHIHPIIAFHHSHSIQVSHRIEIYVLV